MIKICKENGANWDMMKEAMPDREFSMLKNRYYYLVKKGLLKREKKKKIYSRE